MQRIRSQLGSVPQAGTALNQIRPHSKRAGKAQTLDSSFHCANKPLNNHQFGQQHAIPSLRTASAISTSSMKNLRVVPFQHGGKNSMQNTSRQGNSHSAFSARILKEIIRYSNRGSKLREMNKEGNQAIHLQIDLDKQIQNMCAKGEKENKVFNDNFKSNQTDTKNSSNGKSQGRNKRQQKREHKVIEQFSTTPECRQKARKSISLCEEKQKPKEHHLFIQNLERKKKCINDINTKSKGQSHRASQDQKEYSSTKHDLRSSQSSQQQSKDGQQPTNEFINIVSHESTFLKKQKPQLYHKQAQIQQQKTRVQKNNKITTQQSSKIDEFYDSIKNKSVDVLLQQKQNLTILLEQSSVFIEEHFQLNYKQLIPLWKGLIDSEIKKNEIKQELQKLQNNIKKLINQSSIKKTTLFELNRDQVTRKKQKQQLTRTTRQKCIQQAKTIQQQLRIKLSSKVDYEHIIVFNQKIILPIQIPIEQVQKMYEQFFQKKMCKKFILIAKKQLNNLNLYDSRLIQDFFKKIQQLQTHYHMKIDANLLHQKNSPIGQYHNHGNQIHKIEKLVEQIQQLTLSIECIEIEKQMLYKKQEKINSLANQCDSQIRDYLLKTNKKISGEYKVAEGCSFDFKIMLEDKFVKQFQAFHKEINYRNSLIQKIQTIDKEIISKQKINVQPNPDSTQYRPHSEKDISNKNTKSKGKSSKRSCSLISTPSNRQSVIVQDDGQGNEQEMRNAVLNFKKHHVD